MSKSILYYPTIEFKREDYRWLWNASLLWDKIYRIVPPGYKLNEPRNIKELCSTGEIGIPISPVSYAHEASVEFSDFMAENQNKAAALSLVESEDLDYIRIHLSKMDVKLLKDVFYKMKKINEDDNWLYANPNTVNFYMTFLANHIAQKNSLSLYTRNQELWTTTNYFLYNGDIQEMYMPSEHYLEPSTEALLSIMIPDIFPSNILDVTPQEILKFREKRKDERNEFISVINHLQDELKKADAPEIVEVILNDEKKRIEDALRQYKKSLDIKQAIRFGGVLTTTISLAVDALGYAPDIPELFKDILKSSGVWINVLTGVLNKHKKDINNPYTYLAHINSSFAFHPGIRDLPIDCSLWDEYNYTLYRGFEEFIND